MAGLNHAYTCYYHRKYLTSGFLWQGRFKLQPVQKETHLLACARYIERNPVRASMVYQAEDYFYSSAKFYCRGEQDSFAIESPVFLEFGEDINSRRITYTKFLRNFNSEDEEAFRKLEAPQGNKEFMRRLIKEQGRLLPKRSGRPRETIVA